MNSKFFCLSILSSTLAVGMASAAYAREFKQDVNGDGQRYDFDRTSVRPYSYAPKYVPSQVPAHRVTHGNIPKSKSFLTGVDPELIIRPPAARKPILVTDTTIMARPMLQSAPHQTFKTAFGKPVGEPAQQPLQARAGAISVGPQSSAPSSRPASRRPAVRRVVKQEACGRLLPPKQAAPVLTPGPQIANYDDRFYGSGIGMNSRSDVHGTILPRSNP